MTNKIQLTCDECGEGFELSKQAYSRKKRWGSYGNYCKKCRLSVYLYGSMKKND